MPTTLALVSYCKADVIDLVIRSAAAGTVRPDLVVVSDDGSDDGTPDIAEQACKDAGLPHRILRHPRVGLYRLQTMRNAAIAEALDGPILLSDSDCILAPRTLEAHARIHAEYPLAVGTGTRFEYLEGTSGEFTSMYSTLEFAHAGRPTYIVPFGANMSFTKTLWRQLGGFDRSYEGRYGFDDHEFVLRAEQFGAVVHSDPSAYVYHCPHDTIFGNRDPGSNATIFAETFDVDYGKAQHDFIQGEVLPGYWRGERRSSLLGAHETLDSYGAPPGYHPPPHVRYTRSLAPLRAEVEQVVGASSEEQFEQLRTRMGKVDTNRMPMHYASTHLTERLKRLLLEAHRPYGSRDTRNNLESWLEWEAAVSGSRTPAKN